MIYADMQDLDMEPTPKLISQYTIFGKAPRFTHPNKAVTMGLKIALYHIRPNLLNYAAWIHHKLINYGAN